MTTSNDTTTASQPVEIDQWEAQSICEVCGGKEAEPAPSVLEVLAANEDPTYACDCARPTRTSCGSAWCYNFACEVSA